MRVSNRPILALAAATILSACGADDAMLIAEILRGQQPPGSNPVPTSEPDDGPAPDENPPVDPTPPDEISEEQLAVQAILDENCASCHGPEAVLGGMDSMDIDYLVDRDLIIPGNAMESPIFIAMDQERMPPPSVLDQRPTRAEVRRVGRFIDNEL